jgi:chromosome partitioning protein
MKILAIANHKGGVGKTATSHALGETLAFELGQRVLLVDNDAQASLTGACGVSEVERGLAEVLGDANKIRLHEVFVEIAPKLTLVPADLALAPMEMQLQAQPKAGYLLRDALVTVASDFDIALIDCAPNLGLLTINALAAADAVLALTQPQSVDLKGVRIFLEAVGRIRADLNPALELFGILVTFFDNRFNHHRDVVSQMQNAGYPVLDVKIGRSVRVAEAAARGKSVVTADPKNPQSENYRNLAALVAQWLINEKK